jgi:hypothetical protein
MADVDARLGVDVADDGLSDDGFEDGAEVLA